MYKETIQDLVQGWHNSVALYEGGIWYVNEIIDSNTVMLRSIQESSADIIHELAVDKNELEPYWPEPGYYNIDNSAIYLKFIAKKQYKRSFIPSMYKYEYPNPIDMYLIGKEPISSGNLSLLNSIERDLPPDKSGFSYALSRNVAVANYIYGQYPVIVVNQIQVGYLNPEIVLLKSYSWLKDTIEEVLV